MKLDANAKYQETHEWARPEGDLMVCGISDHAQDSLSDVVYVELPRWATCCPKATSLA